LREPRYRCRWISQYFVTDSDGRPKEKTFAAWKKEAERAATKMSKRDNFKWHAVVFVSEIDPDVVVVQFGGGEKIW